MPGDPGFNLDGTPVNRYSDLVDAIPKGQFYDATGIRIPYQGTKPYDLVVQTAAPARTFGIFTNGRFRGTVTTDSDAVARFTITLDLGKNDVELEDDVTGQRIRTTLDARYFHTTMAALAEVLEGIDASVTDSFNDRCLMTAERGQIEDVWGKRLLHLNTPAYEHEAYREQLQEVHQAYRMFGGRQKGLDSAVSAVTTVTPMRWSFRTFGPRWVLGGSLLRNAAFQERDRTQWTRASNIPGVTPLAVAAANQTGAGTLTFSLAGPTRLLQWTTPGGAIGPTVDVAAGGTFEIPGVALPARLDGRINGPFNIVGGTNDALRLNLDGIGSIDITLTAGGARTAAQVAADINGALAADTRYGVTYNAVASVLTTQRVRLQTPAGTAGAAASIVLEVVANAAYATVFSYPWIRSTLLNPEIIGSVSLELASSDTFREADTDDTFQVVIARGTVREELVTISGNNRTTDILTVPAPGLVLAKNAGDVVEQAGQFPYQVNGSDNFEQGITVEIDAGLLPGIGDTETVTLLGSNVPDGWFADNATADLLDYGWFDFEQIALTNDGTGDTTIETDALARAFDHLEWPFTFEVWVRNRHTAAINVQLGVDYGAGWVESGATAVPSINADGGDAMTRLSYSTVLPATSSSCTSGSEMYPSGRTGKVRF